MPLKPDTQHADYSANVTRWAKCRDVIDGEDAVHKAGAKYLPKLSGQSDEDYSAYVMRTPFYNATARTIDGMVGLLFRKDPVITSPAAMQQFIDDMTLEGTTFYELAEIAAREILGVGRFGLLVEYPYVDAPPASVADAIAKNLRPYVTSYKAETIINWRVQRVNNVMQPVMIALREAPEVWQNQFEAKAVEQIRVLSLEEGKYIQRLYRKNEKGDEWVQNGDDIIPLKSGKHLTAIPFVFFGSNHNGPEVQKAPVYDLVTLNLSHYRTSADLEHGAHFTGLPTPVVSGYSLGSEEKLSIGSSTAWVFPSADAKASYLEFTGQGLGALESRLQSKEAAMAAIGARMLAPEKSGAEAAQTVKLRHAGESAVLGTIGDMNEQAFLRVLQLLADWAGISGEIKLEFNEDFIETTATAQDVLAWVQAWQAGGMSFETLFRNLKRGELIDDERTLEQEQDAIKDNPAPVATSAEPDSRLTE